MNRFFTVNDNLDSHILIHIPHSSLHIPQDMTDDYLLSKEQLELDCKILADMYTDDLFGVPFEKFGGMRLDVNRAFIDVERFREDNNEPMSKIGMGVAYTKTSELKDLRILKYKDKILDIYDAYHSALDNLVEQKVQKFGKCLIVDCHSFPSIPRAFMLDSNIDDIAICIGYEDFHKDINAVFILENGFKAKGYKVSHNMPYSGSIVSNKHFGKDNRVKSVMIELNRGIYMDDIHTFKQNENYQTIKNIIEDTFNKLKI